MRAEPFGITAHERVFISISYAVQTAQMQTPYCLPNTNLRQRIPERNYVSARFGALGPAVPR